MNEPLSRTWYAETVCQMIAHGEPMRDRVNGWGQVVRGWDHYLARWIWLKDKNLERDP